MEDRYQEFLEDFYYSLNNGSTPNLQIAAELGNKLLEVNKELENEIKRLRLLLDEKDNEIEHLTKKTTALRSTNDHRIRLYEQLEVSIADLERANHRLALDNATKTKEIKSLRTLLETSDQRNEELQSNLDEANALLKNALRNDKTIVTVVPPSPDSPKDRIDELLQQNRYIQEQRAKEQRKIADLEAELSRKDQEINILEDEIVNLHSKERDMLTAQEKIRSEADKICRRCLNIADETLPHRVELHLDSVDGNVVIDPSQYRHFLEETPAGFIQTNNCPSLQEELKMSGDFSKEPPRRGKATPTDLSEVETLSSGFSDETSCKATQTEMFVLFADANDGDCKLQIYDSLIRQTPSYRALFDQINACLKRASLIKEEDGDKDAQGDCSSMIVKEEVPIDLEDLISLPGSVIESIGDSITETIASETSSIADFDKIVECNSGDQQELEHQQQVLSSSSSRETTKDILEYATIMTCQKKTKKSSKNKGRQSHGLNTSNTSTPTQRRARYQPEPFEIKFENIEVPSPSRKRQWRNSGKLLTTIEKTEGSPSSPQPQWVSQVFVSTAAREVAKLKKLEKSYAEVLRTPPQQTVYRRKDRQHFSKSADYT